MTNALFRTRPATRLLNLKTGKATRRGVRARLALGFSILFLSGCITGNPAESGATVRLKSLSLSECKGGLLDDLEDGDSQIAKLSERDGYWFTFADNVGSTITPQGGFESMPGGRPGAPKSERHVNIRGKLAETGDSIYVGAGFAFTNPKTPFDVSKATGIRFWAKGPGTVRFKTPDVNTDPSGDRCSDCYNDFGVDIELSDRWERYTVPFSEMQQLPGWGDRAPHVASGALFAVQWQISTAGASYDVSIDDVELVGCEGRDEK